MWVRGLVLSAMSLCLAACGGGDGSVDSRIEIVLWKHQTGPAEEAGNDALFERFNASQDQWRLAPQTIPQRAYTESVMASAMAGQMPCILTVDQPKVPSFVWAGHLRPLDDLIAPGTLDGVTETAIGRYEGQTYSVGQFDAALAIFARRSVLDRVGARIPTVDDPWSKDEFDRILADIKATGDFPYVLDLQTRDGYSDWWTYGFSPLLQSYGGDLIDRDGMVEAEGTLNGPEAIAFALWFQDLFEKGLVNRKEPDEFAFQRGRVAMSYTGNWWAPGFSEAHGDDMVILPPPDFGKGTVIGGGSWQWAISSGCENPEAAAAFIEFLITPEEVAAMSEAAGMIPVSDAAAAMTEKFRVGGEWRTFFELMKRYARPRPETPAFATISNAWFKAMQDVMNGKDVRDALDDAVDEIEQEIADNGGFNRSLPDREGG